MKIEKVKELVKERNLQIMGLTGASNGYPEPDLGWFVHGFANFQEAENFAKKVKGEICQADWKDGWGYAHYGGVAFDSLGKPQSDWYGDDYEVLEKVSEFDFEEVFGESQEEKIEDLIDCGSTLEEATEAVKDDILEYKKYLEELKTVDFKKNVAVVREGFVLINVLPRDCMEWADDMSNVAVGVAVEI
jgi:hypothetical protein